MTTKQNRPNLFTYATSELSQDAFICWLAEWADPKYKKVDSALHQAGQEFIVSMVQKVKPGFESTAIESVGIEPQFQKLDILIKINGDSPNKLAILIEDKTHTSNHSDQLERYRKLVGEAGYQEDQMIPLYFKTGYQSRFDTIGVYKTYLRNDFLAMLQNGKREGVVNAIYDDFLAHLLEIDTLIKQFSTKPTQEWTYHDWVGFFTVLYDQRSVLSSASNNDETNWGYVANPAGGFVGFWWYYKKLVGRGFTPYLQLEEEKLCFKIVVDDDMDKATTRDEAYRAIVAVAGRDLRPKRMGNGKYMTVAQMDSYLHKDSEGLVNIEATIEELKKAQDIIDAAFRDSQPTDN
ncbi:PD-(D/E)XK nuclease family protein [Fibrella sp. HMF5335]|uniref:PD-(D/E)XK nuclease family protein n=1 Tax=Fibrella rubiginis TaxID=2817060 RepID=A0A939GF81_9BACT|nr:PD-(D/E)XK nuclease family protein [Fibrella rubiginis]MBO0936134.1 PD-(D/E)XK nuclease family protein [Fibrella rubiginis]